MNVYDFQLEDQAYQAITNLDVNGRGFDPKVMKGNAFLDEYFGGGIPYF